MKFQLFDKQRDMIVLVVFVLFYVGFALAASLFQYKIIYMPNAQDFASCPRMQDAERITYEGTRMYYKKAGSTIAVVYHGNAGSACDRDYWADIFEKRGLSYLIVEYAGYSNDTKHSPSHALLKRDVEHAVAFLQTKSFAQTIVAGESLGVGFASYHAQLRPPEKLLLVAAFPDIVSVAKKEYWFYPSFVIPFLVENGLDNVTALARYTGDVMIIHGKADNILPLHFGQELYDALRTPHKEMVIIDGAGHNDIFGYSETYSAIERFLR